MRVVSYIRVSKLSTDDQLGISLSVQEHKIKQYAELYNHTIIGVVKDVGLSAKNMNREGFLKIIDMVKKKEIEGVIIYKLDRLTRNVGDLSEIIDLFNNNKISLISISENLDSITATGRMVLNMICTVAQWERETIGERTSAVLKYKRDKGLKYTKDPIYGFKLQQNQLKPIQEEQDTINIILDLFNNGVSYSSISNQLNMKKLKPRSGKYWFPQQIKRIVQNISVRNSIIASQMPQRLYNQSETGR